MLSQGPAALRAERRAHELHLRRLNEMRPTMRISAPAEYSHLRFNAKKALQRREWEENTARENSVLLGKLYNVLSRPTNSTDEQPFGGYDVQLHEATIARRRTQQRQLDNQNAQLVTRIQNLESEYSPHRLQNEYDILERARGTRRPVRPVVDFPLPEKQSPPTGRMSTLQPLGPISKAKQSQSRRGDPKPRGDPTSPNALLLALLDRMTRDAEATLQTKVKRGDELGANEQALVNKMIVIAAIETGHLVTPENLKLAKEFSVQDSARGGKLLSDEELEVLREALPTPEMVPLETFWEQAVDLPLIAAAVRTGLQQRTILAVAKERGLGSVGFASNFEALLESADEDD